MNPSYWTTLIVGFAGVLVGSIIPLIGNLLAKRAERRNEISKLIAEKRLDAYEEIISNVRLASVGAGAREKGEYVKTPLILEDLDGFDKWFVAFVAIYRKVSHLIDGDLANELWVFHNYLHMLSEYLDKCRDENRKVQNEHAVREIGKVVYKDFLFLTDRIIRQVSRFYSAQIYGARFKPSTLEEKSETYILPKFFKQLAIISRKDEIEHLVGIS